MISYSYSEINESSLLFLFRSKLDVGSALYLRVRGLILDQAVELVEVGVLGLGGLFGLYLLFVPLVHKLKVLNLFDWLFILIIMNFACHVLTDVLRVAFDVIDALRLLAPEAVLAVSEVVVGAHAALPSSWWQLKLDVLLRFLGLRLVANVA